MNDAQLLEAFWRMIHPILPSEHVSASPEEVALAFLIEHLSPSQRAEFNQIAEVPILCQRYVHRPHAFTAIGGATRQHYRIFYGDHANIVAYGFPFYNTAYKRDLVLCSLPLVNLGRLGIIHFPECCGQSAPEIPYADVMLAQKLMIEANEPEFARTVNIYGHL